MLKILTLYVLSVLYYKISQTPNTTCNKDLIVETVPKIGYWLGPIWLILVSIIYTLFITKYGSVHVENWGLYEIFGSILCFIASILRLWSYKTLGRLFTFDLAIRSRHKLISSGPYRYIRHPSYTGLILATLGYSLFVFDPKMVDIYSQLLGWDKDKLECIVFFNFLMVSPSLLILGLLLYRIPREEDMLFNAFKQKWTKYSKNTWKLIPYIW